jgi:hypothetical protein
MVGITVQYCNPACFNTLSKICEIREKSGDNYESDPKALGMLSSCYPQGNFRIYCQNADKKTTYTKIAEDEGLEPTRA